MNNELNNIVLDMIELTKQNKMHWKVLCPDSAHLEYYCWNNGIQVVVGYKNISVGESKFDLLPDSPAYETMKTLMHVINKDISFMNIKSNWAEFKSEQVQG